MPEKHLKLNIRLLYKKRLPCGNRCNDCFAILAAYHYTIGMREISYIIKNGIFDSVATIALQSLPILAAY